MKRGEKYGFLIGKWWKMSTGLWTGWRQPVHGSVNRRAVQQGWLSELAPMAAVVVLGKVRVHVEVEEGGAHTGDCSSVNDDER